HPPPGDRIEDHADERKYMNSNEIQKRTPVALRGLPPWSLPWFRSEAGDDRSRGRDRLRFCEKSFDAWFTTNCANEFHAYRTLVYEAPNSYISPVGCVRHGRAVPR